MLRLVVISLTLLWIRSAEAFCMNTSQPIFFKIEIADATALGVLNFNPAAGLDTPNSLYTTIHTDYTKSCLTSATMDSLAPKQTQSTASSLSAPPRASIGFSAIPTINITNGTGASFFPPGAVFTSGSPGSSLRLFGPFRNNR